MKRKHFFRSVSFYLSWFFIFGFLGFGAHLIDMHWYGRLIWLFSTLSLPLIRKTKIWRFPTLVLCWIMALSLVLVPFRYLRPETHVSTRGVFMREALRFVTQNESIIETGEDIATERTFWRPPRNFIHQVHQLDHSKIEVLIPKESDSERIILQLHGGAYTMGMIDVYRNTAVKYSRLSGDARVITLDYRTAPQHTFPAALEDAIDTWTWMMENGYDPENTIIVGDSAGGNLALVLTLYIRDHDLPMPKGLVLMSPWTDLAARGESYQTLRDLDPLFSKPVKPSPYADDHPLEDPYLSPAYAQFHDFVPMLIQVGTHEILFSDSQIIYEKAQKENIPVQLSIYQGMFHVFQLYGSWIPESHQAWEEIQEFMDLLFGNG